MQNPPLPPKLFRPSTLRPAKRSTSVSFLHFFAFNLFDQPCYGPSFPHSILYSRLFSSSPFFFSLFPPSSSSNLLFVLAKMVSASKAARMAKRAEAGDKKAKKASKEEPVVEADVNGDEQPATTDAKMKDVEKLTQQMDKHGLSDRVTTGVLSSLPASRDVKITSASLVFHGKVLFTDSTLELNFSRRYGLLGENGCGKSTLLKAIATREFPFPEHIDLYLLNEGAPVTDKGALEWVVDEAQAQLEAMEKRAEEILEQDGPESPILEDLYDVSFLHFSLHYQPLEHVGTI